MSHHITHLYIILVRWRVYNLAASILLSYALQRLGTPVLKPKPEHVAYIKCVYERRDVFVWLPTGFVEYLCYEGLPFVMDFKRLA